MFEVLRFVYSIEQIGYGRLRVEFQKLEGLEV